MDKDGKCELSVSTAAATAYFPPNANSISGSKSDDAADAADSGGGGIVVLVDITCVAPLFSCSPASPTTDPPTAPPLIPCPALLTHRPSPAWSS